jgi:hypothetical protein
MGRSGTAGRLALRAASGDSSSRKAVGRHHGWVTQRAGDGDSISTDLERLLASRHPVDRAAAGRRLASLAGRPDVDSLLHALLLHDEDTLVPFETAEALSERRDSVGTRILAKAVAEADHRDLPFHWILDAVGNVWMQTFEDAATAQRLCAALIDDADSSVRTGARELLDFTKPTKRA